MINFEFEGKTYQLKKPTSDDINESQIVRAREFNLAVKSGAMFRDKLDSHLEEQGLWDDKKETKFRTLREEIMASELKLKKGKIPLKVARQLAIEMKEKREDLKDLISIKSRLESYTAEGRAENMAFNALVARCLVYNDTGQPVYKDLNDYLNHGDDGLAIEAARRYALMMNDMSIDHEKRLPENKFLLEYGLVDSNLHLVDKQGRLIDKDGRLVNKDGKWINEEGKPVDRDGNVLNEDGDYDIKTEPFLDDDGKPVLPVGKVEVLVPPVVNENLEREPVLELGRSE